MTAQTIAPGCDATSPSPVTGKTLVCTLDRDHGGDHEAWGTSGTRPLHTWPQARRQQPAAAPNPRDPWADTPDLREHLANYQPPRSPQEPVDWRKAPIDARTGQLITH